MSDECIVLMNADYNIVQAIQIAIRLNKHNEEIHSLKQNQMQWNCISR